MRKLFLCFVLLGAFATVSTVQHPVQGQGGAKKAKAGVIEIGEGKDGKFRFFVRDADGKLLAMSGPGGFATEKEARAAVDTLKEVVRSAKVTTIAKKGSKDKKGSRDK
jgi:hypothetical protein